MTISLGKSAATIARSVAVVTRKSLSVDESITDFVRLKMHDANASQTVDYAGRINGVDLDGTMGLLGSSVAFNDTASLKPGNGTGSADNYIVTPSALNRLFQVDNLESSGMLAIMLAFRFSTNVPAEYLLSMKRHVASAPGGYSIMTSNQQFQLNYRIPGSSAAAQAKKGSLEKDKWHTGLAIIGGFDGTIRACVDGNVASAESVDWYSEGDGAHPSFDALYGPVAIGAQINTSAGSPTYANKMNDAVNDALEIHNLWALRFSQPPSETWLAQLFMSYHKNPRETPDALVAVGY